MNISVITILNLKCMQLQFKTKKTRHFLPLHNIYLRHQTGYFWKIFEKMFFLMTNFAVIKKKEKDSLTKNRL